MDRIPSELLRARREWLGLSHEALGQALGSVRADTISAWERGKDPIPFRIDAELRILEGQADAEVARLTERGGQAAVTAPWQTSAWQRRITLRATRRRDGLPA